MEIIKNLNTIKNEEFDYLVVGAGFAGSVLAERLNSIGKRVLVIDKRRHIGGNCFDYHDKFGVLVHKYGPHYFRTNFKDVEKYLSRFTKWRPFEYRVRIKANNRLYTFPINKTTINEFFGTNLKTTKEVENFINSKREPIKNPKNSKEQILSLIGKEIYETFFKNYTIKQWGIDPIKLEASVTARIPIRTNDDDRYVSDKFQAMPKHGYTKLFENLLKNIKISLNTDLKKINGKIKYKNLIHTGPIDEFFDYQYGKLPYRSLKFKFEHYDKYYYQDWPQINYPNDYKFTRIVEIKHVTGQKISGTTITKEFPCWGKEPFYPVPTKENEEIYKKYAEEASKLNNVHFIGRLAQYKYFNMDQVVKESLDLFNNKLINNP